MRNSTSSSIRPSEDELLSLKRLAKLLDVEEHTEAPATVRNDLKNAAAVITEICKTAHCV